MYVGKTLFAQVMEFVPWISFARIVHRPGGHSGVRTLSCAELSYIRARSRAHYACRAMVDDGGCGHQP